MNALKNFNLCRPDRFAIFKLLFSFESFQDRYGKSWKSLSLLTMCAQWNSPLGPSRNNEQSVTGNTRLHYQLNYQLELIRTAAWNEFGCGPASFFCCVPEYTPVNEPILARLHVHLNYRAQKRTGVCLSRRAKSILMKETVGRAWDFNHGDTEPPPHVLHKCL